MASLHGPSSTLWPSFALQVIHVTGRLRPRRPSYPHGHSVLGRVLGLVALAHTLPPSTLSEVRIECHMFVFRVNMDLQIVYCESRWVKETAGLWPVLAAEGGGWTLTGRLKNQTPKGSPAGAWWVQNLSHLGMDTSCDLQLLQQADSAQTGTGPLSHVL